MSSISIRLPTNLERRLNEEARRARKRRSEIVREAIGEYVARKERERHMAEVVAAAKALRDDPATRHEAEELVGEGLETWLESVEAEERAAGIDPGSKWWE